MAIENNSVRSVGINGALRFQDAATNNDLYVIGATTGVPFGNYYANTRAVTTATTLAASTNAGYITYCKTDGIVFTLPAVSVSTVGLAFQLMNTASDGGALINLKSGGATDWFLGGMGVTATTNLVLTNTKATQRRGDSITVVNSGSTAWIVQEVVGTWALAATT